MLDFLAARKKFLVRGLARRNWRKTDAGKAARRAEKRRAEARLSQRKRYAVLIWALTHHKEIEEYHACMAIRRSGRKRLKKQNYRARKSGAMGRLSKGLRVRLFDSQGGRCAACGTTGSISGYYGLHLDHITPLARGGANEDDNVQLLCQPCNTTKGASFCG